MKFFKISFVAHGHLVYPSSLAECHGLTSASGHLEIFFPCLPLRCCLPRNKATDGKYLRFYVELFLFSPFSFAFPMLPVPCPGIIALSFCAKGRPG